MWTVDTEEDALKPDGSPYSMTDLREIQDWVIRPQLRMVRRYRNQCHWRLRQAVSRDALSEKLLSFGLTPQDVVLALERNNLNVGAGYIEKSGEQYLVRTGTSSEPGRDRRYHSGEPPREYRYASRMSPM